MFWKRKQEEREVDPIPFGSLRIVPNWDGGYSIERYTVELAGGYTTLRVVRTWTVVKDGFGTRRAALDRIKHMGVEEMLYSSPSEAA